MKYLAICLVLLGCGRTSAPTVATTVAFSANPAVIQQGQCTTLTWSSTNAPRVSIDQGVGKVDPSGSQQVCPAKTTQYAITAAGDGGTGAASATLSVTVLATKVMTFPEAALFEFGKSDLKAEGNEKIKEYREQAKAELSRADKVIITGYTDNVGDSVFNSTLSLRRAEAVRDSLVTLGADSRKFQVGGAGESKPIADNSTDEGRAKNRRVEVEVVGVEK